ncbi:hypothetical protein [Nocardioides sp. AE5]|uniref:hypothetical protein n=1 Tax=Nocardioides sp. AE5 TaxID=2962573 RepID=UPI0028821E30|nr:hypothetical protein [Nocardioides sp. AE5]MDT0202089.1 hypothetical protein [Nocardioides sp. AE5]
MTWEQRLFSFLDDIEAQAESAFALERDLEVADRARGEYAAVHLAERLMASVDAEVNCLVLGVGRLGGRLARVADGWVLMEAAEREWVVRIDALTSVRGLSRRAVPRDAWPVTARLGLPSALRQIAEDGGACRIWLVDGTSHDVALERVGADFVEAVLVGGGGLVLAFTTIAAVASQA